MKNIIIYLFLPLMFISSVNAQKKTGGIFNIDFNIQDSILDLPFEGKVLDSLERATRAKFGELLRADVDFIYRINKKGKKFTTVPVLNMIGYLPNNSFKNSRKNYNRDLYIQIVGHIYSQGGQQIHIKYGKASQIAPLVRMTVWVFDKDKKRVYHKQVERGDFGNLRSIVETERDNRSILSKIVFREGKEEWDKLYPEEILYIYCKALELLE